MASRLKPRLIAGTVAGLAVAGGGAALAADQLGGSPKQESQAVVNDAAKQLGVTPGALSSALKKALENRVDAAVAAGRLTKAQGEELKQHIESGDLPLFGGPGLGMHHAFGMFGRGLDAAASYLGLTEDQLRTQLESGKTLGDVAKAHNKSVDGLVNAIVAGAKQKLDAARKAGRITQSQEDSMLSDIKSRVTDFVNGKVPPRPGFRHFDGGAPPGDDSGFPGPGI
jgi:hypothetical protein